MSVSASDDLSARPSKTQKKAAMRELQDLGAALTELSRDQVKGLALPEDCEDVRAAVLDYQRISGFEAKRRQLQFIGKLMRGVDAEPIRAALAHAKGDSAEEIARLHRLEGLREKFLEDEKAGLADILAAYPAADATYLRQLRKSVLKERAEAKPPRQFRVLFQTLKTLAASPPPAD